ncbi:MAG: hypothetical protein M0P13_12095 [Fibrobacteraceae bacterium]|nr:hypothetical protein [Fibrobacteraceae bacterium]
MNIGPALNLTARIFAPSAAAIRLRRERLERNPGFLATGLLVDEPGKIVFRGSGKPADTPGDWQKPE